MMNNGAVHVVSIIILNRMSSEAKASIPDLYINAKDGVIIRNTLEFFSTHSWKQPYGPTIPHQKE